MPQKNKPENLIQDIQTEAQRLGFLWIGLTRPRPPAHYDVYLHWLEQKHHGSMGYLANERALERRLHPGLALPNAQTILSAGFPYGAPRPDPGRNFGRIAAYALSVDYHLLIPPLLEQLRGRIAALTGLPANGRAYTDTGPFLEREFGAQSGLGWIGKNTCLINPSYGSYFLLAELFLDLELPPSSPYDADRCGSCRRCIDACPTGCILPNRTLDARRCISYLTIENKGAIPAELRPSIGNWVFGCDICQIVCPWNRFHKRSPFAPPAPNPTQAPLLREEIALTPTQFNQKFKNSPIQRPRRRGYLRNIAVALGNSGDPAAIAALGKSLAHEPEPLVRGHCAWALGRFSQSAARDHLTRALRQEADPYVRAEILAALQGQSSQGDGTIPSNG